VGIVAFPLLICVIGLLLWAISTNALVKDAGRMAFQIGLFFTVWACTPMFVHLLSR
jgi:hypothetical protein